MPDHTLTTSAGAPIADNQTSITAGPRGPLLLQDYQLLEKLAHQNRERIPERIVHAKGWGAFGTLTVTHDITRAAAPRSSAPSARKPICSCASPPSPANSARLTPSATCAASHQVLHRGRQLGSGGQQHAQCSSFAIHSSSRTSSAPRSGIPGPICVQRRRCGISGRCRPKACIR